MKKVKLKRKNQNNPVIKEYEEAVDRGNVIIETLLKEQEVRLEIEHFNELRQQNLRKKQALIKQSNSLGEVCTKRIAEQRLEDWDDTDSQLKEQKKEIMEYARDTIPVAYKEKLFKRFNYK